MRASARGVAAVALAALLSGSAPATATQQVPSGPWLVVSGLGSRYTDVTLTQPVTFDEQQRRFFTYSGCGRYHGFYLRPLSPSLRPFTPSGSAGFGMFAAASFDYPSGLRWPVALGDGVSSERRTVLRPGRYRLVLLGEGRCEVRMPIARGVKNDWRVHTQTEWRGVRFAEKSLVPTGQRTMGPFAGTASVPIDVREGDYVLGVLHTWTRTPSGAADLEIGTDTICLDDVPAVTCPPHQLGDGGKRHYAWHAYSRHSGDKLESGSDALVFALPNDLPSGRLYAKAITTQTMVGGEVSAVAVVLALPT